MTKQIDSSALGSVQRALGLTGAGAPDSVLHDGDVYQVLDVGPLARRGRTQLATGGIYAAVLQNVHGGATDEQSEINPYSPGVNAVPPYPAEVGPQFDVWLLGATLTINSGAGGLTRAMLFLGLGATSIGWGVNSVPAPVAPAPQLGLCYWDALVVQGGVQTVGIQENGDPFARFGLRLPRTLDTKLLFGSTSAAAVTFDCQILLGVFPVGLGQDALSS